MICPAQEPTACSLLSSDVFWSALVVPSVAYSTVHRTLLSFTHHKQASKLMLRFWNRVERLGVQELGEIEFAPHCLQKRHRRCSLPDLPPRHRKSVLCISIRNMGKPYTEHRYVPITTEVLDLALHAMTSGGFPRLLNSDGYV